MTRYTEDQRVQLDEQIRDREVQRLEYDPEGDYYTLVVKGGFEFSFRFMADLRFE